MAQVRPPRLAWWLRPVRLSWRHYRSFADMCLLRVSGPQVDPARVLIGTTLLPDRVYHAGDPIFPSRPEGRRHVLSGFSVVVADTTPTDLQSQVARALAFLDRHATDILAIHESDMTPDIRLDFPVRLRAGREVAAQFESFPADLVRRAGALGVGLAISIYPCDDPPE
jgi:hypothetical protein